MKRDFDKLKSTIVEMIYRNMYKSNYQTIGMEVTIITTRTNSANKRALAIALKEKTKNFGERKHGASTTFENTVSKEDSCLNMKALALAHDESTPLTNACTRSK